METLKHMERFNTQTHLVHSHSRVSEKRAFAFSTQITLLTLCRNISTLTPEACRRHIQLLPTGQPPMGASSWPWRHYTKHPRGGEQQLIWANLDGFPLLMLRREEKSEFFFFLETMYIAHILEELRVFLLLFTAFSRRAAEEKLLISLLWWPALVHEEIEWSCIKRVQIGH